MEIGDREVALLSGIPGMTRLMDWATAPFHDRPTERQCNGKDSIRQKENQKASNRQCSHLKDSYSCVLLANQT